MDDPTAQLDELASFAASLHLVSVDAAQNRQRFYAMAWQPSLFGGWGLLRQWGPIGSQGRTVVTFYPDRESAAAEIRALLRVRLRHVYRVTDVR